MTVCSRQIWFFRKCLHNIVDLGVMYNVFCLYLMIKGHGLGIEPQWPYTTLSKMVILNTTNRIPTRRQYEKGSHVYFLLQVFWVILLFDINVVLMLPWWPDATIIQSDVTIVVPWQLLTGSIHDYLFCYCPLVDILFEVLRIKRSVLNLNLNNCSAQPPHDFLE